MRDRAIIAPRIVEAAKKGESDPGHLCAAAMAATCQGRRLARGARLALRGTKTYNPVSGN
jgi:hypothetical protein